MVMDGHFIMASTGYASPSLSGGHYLPDHLHALMWFLYSSFVAVACYVCWDLNIITAIYQADRSHLTTVIAALVVFTSVFAAWHVIRYSQQIEVAKKVLQHSPSHHHVATNQVAEFLAEAETASLNVVQNEQQSYDAILEIYADKLRSPVETGWFLVDLAVRLGLIGTIIGFILIFTSLSDTSIDGAEGLKELLVTMSGGMGTALFTTLCGLTGATLLSVQFMILGRQSEHLIGLLLRLSNSRCNNSRINNGRAGNSRLDGSQAHKVEP